LFVVLAFAVSVYGDGSCINPLFVNCLGRFCQVTFLVTPAQRVDNTGICPSLAPGQFTCCDQTVFNTITTVWTLLHGDIQTAVDDLNSAINLFINPYLNQLQDIANNIQQNFPNPPYTPDQQTAIQTYINSVISATHSFLDVAVGDWANCARALLNYFAGLFCFACEAQWSTFVFPDGNGGYIVLFDTETCTSITGNCLTFFEDIVNYEVAIANAAITLVDAIGGANIDTIPNIDVSFSNCNQSCDTYICYNFIIGLDFGSPFADTTTIAPGRKDVAALGRTPTIPAADYNEMNTAHAGVRNILNGIATDKNKKLGDVTIEYLQNLKTGLNKVTDVTKKLNKLRSEMMNGGKSVSLRATTFTNEYNSSGYPVYANGQGSGLDTSVNSGSFLFNWINYLF